jgi:diguanylate cyclase (GGDEF)-like protein/putative nucleotidyltransferase with HDIG domain
MQESAGSLAKIITIHQSDTIQQAAAKMLSHNVGCLIVVDDTEFVGVISERDVARHVASSSNGAGPMSVAHIMTNEVISCAPGTSAHEARRIMAAHHVRHLPIVEDGAVVGILSVRDVMARQLLEDRAAAEEVAILSKCLKSIDLDEAVELMAAEVPKLFQASNCVVCLYGDSTERPELVCANRCLCFDGHLGDPGIMDSTPAEGGFREEIPAECREHGGQLPRLILPLEISRRHDASDSQETPLRGCVCMCGLAASAMSNKELMSYKAKLAREILVAHLTNASRYQKARLTSLTDALTGVGSRNLLEDKLQAECDRAKRYNRPFSIAIIDLDHFKMINDTLGHAEGDEAIKRLAQCMDDEKRTPDVLARYGGDEFVLLMPETEASAASVLLERIRAKVQQIDLGQGMSMSVSCGIAETMPHRDDVPGEVMRRADLALYEAKSAGRNRVKLWDEAMGRSLNTCDLEIENIKRLQRRIVGLSEKAEKMVMASIWGLVQALEAKDAYTKRHSENVVFYATEIARAMDLGPKHLDLIRRSAMIHDIGKIGIPDAILFKSEPLTPHERRIIKQHPVIAVRILERMSFLEREVAIVRHHHEKWNGQGYPDGIARTAIPLGARVVAVADTFDALTSNRAYHASRSVSESLRILKDSADYDLDPAAVEAMLIWIESIAAQFDKPLEGLTVEDLLSQQSDDETELLLIPDLLVQAATADADLQPAPVSPGDDI